MEAGAQPSVLGNLGTAILPEPKGSRPGAAAFPVPYLRTALHTDRLEAHSFLSLSTRCDRGGIESSVDLFQKPRLGRKRARREPATTGETDGQRSLSSPRGARTVRGQMGSGPLCALGRRIWQQLASQQIIIEGLLCARHRTRGGRSRRELIKLPQLPAPRNNQMPTINYTSK